jgi:hypothetical protein
LREDSWPVRQPGRQGYKSKKQYLFHT